jgi:hypothetical protein
MPSLNEIIDLLMEHYFGTEDTAERYAILHKVQEATQYMKQITVNEITNAEIASKAPMVAPQPPPTPEEYYLEKMSEVVSNAHGSKIYLTRSFTIHDITELENIDSLDMAEIIITFEEIIGVDISLEEHPDTTLGEILDRK